jgi:hypothetical protein
MISDELWLRLSEKLDACRLDASALRAIDQVGSMTPKLNDLRDRIKRKCEQKALAPGLYFLVTVENIGFVLPLGAEITLAGRSCFLGSDACNAINQAFAAACEYFEKPSMPFMSCVIPVDIGELCVLDGPSLGLAAALAFLQRASGQPWPFPVLVTGEITQNRCVHPVGNCDIKLHAALQELGTGSGLILVAAGTLPSTWKIDGDPRVTMVHTLDEAVEAIWKAPLRVQTQFMDLSEWLSRIRKSPDFDKNVEDLLSVLDEAGSRTDRARILHELMIQFRHMGRTVEADRYSQQIKAILDDPDTMLDNSQIQEMEVQRMATELDLFPGPWFREELIRLLGSRMDLPNQVRLRGLLAMVESMNGRGEEAIAARECNLQVHRKRMDLMSEIPVTLCHLTWEAARAGRLDLFQKYARELADCSLTERQWHYNYHSLTAGAALLGLHTEFFEFLQSPNRRFLGAGAPLQEFFRSDEPIFTHPHISTLRALIRICRRVGRNDEALRLGRRFIVNPAHHNLTQWLFVICGIERDLARCEIENTQVDSIRLATDKLLFCHCHATAYYPDLVSACQFFDGSTKTIATLEHEIDRLYY